MCKGGLNIEWALVHLISRHLDNIIIKTTPVGLLTSVLQTVSILQLIGLPGPT